MTEQNEYPAQDAIAVLAHCFWEEEGHPDGKAEEHWQKAEAQLCDGEPAKQQAQGQVDELRN